LYRQEIERLSLFFSARGFWSIKDSPALELAETPVYLESVRSAASFGCAFSRDKREKYYFFITTEKQRKQNGRALERRLHREYKFLTAHETVPGHFLLDSIRRGLKNQVRRQIESPLFYEGWAYYAEALLEEFGYIDDPIDQLVDQKRRLWRAARCMIDAGRATGKIDRQRAVELLILCGFTREEASMQEARFRLNPGYQLCYSLGRREIIQLMEKYAPKLGKDRIHREILTGGEIPFHLIDERLSGIVSEKNQHRGGKGE
jgi:uncharacterized protein (DUF885 family)